MTAGKSMIQMILTIIKVIIVPSTGFIILELIAYIGIPLYISLPVQKNSNGLGEAFLTIILNSFLISLLFEAVFIWFFRKSLVEQVLNLNLVENKIFQLKLFIRSILELVLYPTSVFFIILSFMNYDVIKQHDFSSSAFYLTISSYVFILVELFFRLSGKEKFGILDTILKINYKKTDRD
jgi:hypothetical protein